MVVAAQAHPLKMAYTSVKFNPAKGVFEIRHRVFQDDFEHTLRSNYAYKGGDVFVNQKTTRTQKAVDVFFQKNFSLWFDMHYVPLHYIKTEQKQQMGIIIWYETEKISITTLKMVNVLNQIMMESFTEQVNMFHINIDDTIKRTITFEKAKKRASIPLQ
jgi:hypothetical protein